MYERQKALVDFAIETFDSTAQGRSEGARDDDVETLCLPLRWDRGPPLLGCHPRGTCTCESIQPERGN